MAELLLIVSLLGIFAFGFYIMCRLDRFLEENRKALLKENESREPSEILLPQGLSESEILRSAVFVKRTEMSILFFPTGKKMSISLRYIISRF